MADVRRLPVPVTEIWDWQMHGVCRGMNSEMFFHPERERGPARAAREARAKRVCRGCPVLEQCRDHALAVHEPYGVWGGLTVAERAEQRRDDAPPGRAALPLAGPDTGSLAGVTTVPARRAPAQRHR